MTDLFSMSNAEMLDGTLHEEEPGPSDEGEGDPIGALSDDSSEEAATDEEEAANIRQGFIVDDDDEEAESEDEETVQKKRKKRRRKREYMPPLLETRQPLLTLTPIHLTRHYRRSEFGS